MRNAIAYGLCLVVLGMVGCTNKTELSIVETDLVTTELPKESTVVTKTKKIKVSNIVADPGQVILINTQIDYNSMRLVISRLESAEASGETRMFLVIDSPGGSVVDGAELISYMTSSKMTIDTFCRAICASMAAQIHQVGKTRYIAEKGILMFHPASGGAEGTLEQMKSQVDMFKRYVDRMDMDISKRSGIPYDKFKSMLVSELWLEGVDALELNLADKIASLRFGEAFDAPSEVFDLKKEMDKAKVPSTPTKPNHFKLRDIK